MPPKVPPSVGSVAWFGTFLSNVLTKSATVLGAQAPERQFVSTSRPVPDGGQLTVHWERIRASERPTSSSSRPIGPKMVIPVVDVVVTLFHCVTSITVSGDIPSEAQQEEDALTLAALAWPLWYGITGAVLDGTLFPDQVRPPTLVRDLAQLPVQAGVAGLQLTMEVTLS